MLREVKEETGLTLNSYKLRGIVTYVSTVFGIEYMYVFTSNNFEGKLIECREGDLEWVEKDKVIGLKTWEGDRVFLVCILKENNPFLTARLEYEGEKLIKSDVNEY